MATFKLKLFKEALEYLHDDQEFKEGSRTRFVYLEMNYSTLEILNEEPIENDSIRILITKAHGFDFFSIKTGKLFNIKEFLIKHGLESYQPVMLRNSYVAKLIFPIALNNVLQNYKVRMTCFDLSGNLRTSFWTT